jgi:hypothetical protein
MESNSFRRNGGKFLRDQSPSHHTIQFAAQENLRSNWKFNMPVPAALILPEDRLRALFHLHQYSSIGYDNRLCVMEKGSG